MQAVLGSKAKQRAPFTHGARSAVVCLHTKCLGLGLPGVFRALLLGGSSLCYIQRLLGRQDVRTTNALNPAL